MTFGTWPNRSVITARDEAKRLERDIDRGQDPMDASISARRALTVNWLVERYIAEHLPKLPASSAKDRVSMVKTLVLHDYVMQVSMKSSHHGFFEGSPGSGRRTFANPPARIGRGPHAARGRISPR